MRYYINEYARLPARLGVAERTQKLEDLYDEIQEACYLHYSAVWKEDNEGDPPDNILPEHRDMYKLERDVWHFLEGVLQEDIARRPYKFRMWIEEQEEFEEDMDEYKPENDSGDESNLTPNHDGPRSGAPGKKHKNVVQSTCSHPVLAVHRIS